LGVLLLGTHFNQQLLDPANQRMMHAVHCFEGTVKQVLGDGIMALFGAPIAHEDYALRACYAALAMQAAMRDYTEEVRRTHGLELRLRVSLNSEEVVVRAIGNDLHMDYSAVGQTTHLAARMEQLALASPYLRLGLMFCDNTTNLFCKDITLFCFGVDGNQEHQFWSFEVINQAVSRPLSLLNIRVLDTHFEDCIARPWYLCPWSLASFQLGDDRLDVDLEVAVFLCQLANVAFEFRREFNPYHFRRIIRHRYLPRVLIQAASRHATPPASLAGSSPQRVSR
jgi:hypothetical protein